MTARTHNRRRTGGWLLLGIFLAGVWFLPAAHEALHLHLPSGNCSHSRPAACPPPGEDGDRGDNKPAHDPGDCRLCVIKALPLETAPTVSVSADDRLLPERPVYFTARPHPGPGPSLHLSRAPPSRQLSAV